MDSCTFCKIVNREIPGYIIRETDSVISFLSLEKHPLVVPKAHIANIYALDSENGRKVMDEIVTVAKAMKQGLKADGIFITQANEPAAGQDVFHIHFHLYPRWESKDISE
ncbi:MAG: HIT domain-containing protein [Pseudonocardiaceae bacterium]